MAPFQTPDLRVSRTVSACRRCRNAKTKCDGRLPACTACERAGKAEECTSANDEYAQGKERSYVASLESRIERLEAEHYRLSQRKQRHPGPILHPPTNQTNLHNLHRQKEASDVDDLVSDFGYLSVNATASGYQGFVQEMSFARLLFSTATVNDLPRASVNVFPPRELAVVLVEGALRKVLAFCPILTSPAIFGALESAYQHEGHFCTSQQRWNLRMVLAIGSLCRSTQKGDAQYQSAVSHAAEAAEHREAVIQPGSVASLESILLLVLYAIMDPSHFNPWYTMGVAARVMVDIGLHNDPPDDAHMKNTQLEHRRRVFYCVYVLDRLITMTYMRTPSFTDASIEVQLPAQTASSTSLQDQSLMQPGFNGIWVELIKIRTIQSQAYHRFFLRKREELYKPWSERIALMNEGQAECKRVKRSIPAVLAPMVDSEMCYFDLLTLQPAGGEVPLDPYGEILVFHCAIDYATNTSLICDQSWTQSCATVLDLDRALRVSRWLLDILADDACPALSVESPVPPHCPEGTTLPPIPQYTLSERRTSAIYALTQLDLIIETLCRKFHPPGEDFHYALEATPSVRRPGTLRLWGYRNFKSESSATLERLYSGVSF